MGAPATHLPLVRGGSPRRPALGADADESALQKEMDAFMAMEVEVASVGVPLAYMREFYDLRDHLDFVRKRLAAALEESPS